MDRIRLYEEWLGESIFLTWSMVIPSDFKKFEEAYKELHPGNRTLYDKKKDETVGYRMGEKELHWKYDHDSYKMSHSERERDVLGLINFKKTVAQGHPWSK
jgi:hypothetical protein